MCRCEEWVAQTRSGLGNHGAVPHPPVVDEHAFEDDTVTPQELSSRYPTAPNGTQKRARTATHPTKECSVFWNVKG